MAEPTLTLTPHELFFLPEGTPVTAPAMRLEISPKTGKPFTVLARLVQVLPLALNDAWLYYRVEAKPVEEIYGLGHVCLGCSTCSGELAKPEAIIKTIANRSTTSRYFVAPEAKFGIELPTHGRITVATQPHNRESQFSVTRGHYEAQLQMLTVWGRSQVEEFCSEIWNSNYSPQTHFLHWQNISKSEQNKISAALLPGDWETLLSMLQSVLVLATQEFGGSFYGGLRIVGAPLPMAKRRNHPRHTPAEENAQRYANRWRDALWHILASATQSKKSTATDTQYQFGLWKGVYRREIPTFHETLEAAANLREFLAPHLSLDEIDALFRTDNL